MNGDSDVAQFFQIVVYRERVLDRVRIAAKNRDVPRVGVAPSLSAVGAASIARRQFSRPQPYWLFGHVLPPPATWSALSVSRLKNLVLSQCRVLGQQQRASAGNVRASH